MSEVIDEVKPERRSALFAPAVIGTDDPEGVVDDGSNNPSRKLRLLLGVTELFVSGGPVFGDGKSISNEEFDRESRKKKKNLNRSKELQI